MIVKYLVCLVSARNVLFTEIIQEQCIIGGARKVQLNPRYLHDRYLNTPEKLSKIDSLRKRAMKAESQNMKLREKFVR